MAKRIYANLLGNWTDITDDGYVNSVPAKEFIQNLSYEEGSYKAKGLEYDYVEIGFGDKGYRIHPVMLQIVNE